MFSRSIWIYESSRLQRYLVNCRCCDKDEFDHSGVLTLYLWHCSSYPALVSFLQLCSTGFYTLFSLIEFRVELSADYDTATNVKKLDEATLIVVLVSASLLQDSDLIEELQVAINRQRYGITSYLIFNKLHILEDFADVHVHFYQCIYSDAYAKMNLQQVNCCRGLYQAISCTAGKLTWDQFKALPCVLWAVVIWGLPNWPHLDERECRWVKYGQYVHFSKNTHI